MKKFLLSIFLLLSFFATSLFASQSLEKYGQRKVEMAEFLKENNREKAVFTGKELNEIEQRISERVKRLENSADPNRSFETYTIAELREYIAKLPQTESDPEVLAFEKLALTSDEYLRPLEMSLYYQGWGKDVFYQINTDLDFIFTTPTNRQIRNGKGEIRNAQKAFLYAVLAKILNIKESSVYEPSLAIENLAYLYYEGIGTQKNFEKVREFFDLYGGFYGSTDPVIYPTNCIFYSYLFWYGYAEFPQDKSKALQLQNCTNNLAWRNFYAGFMVPKDRKFALEFLEENARKSNRVKSASSARAILRRIYCGVFDKNDVNKNRYQELLNEEQTMFDKILQNNSKWLDDNTKTLLKKLSYFKPFEPINKIKNPEYDKDFTLNYLINLVKNSKQRELKRNIYENFLRLSYLKTPFNSIVEMLPTLKESATNPEEFSDFEKEYLNDVNTNLARKKTVMKLYDEPFLNEYDLPSDSPSFISPPEPIFILE